MNDAQKEEFIFWFVAGWNIKEASRLAEITEKEDKNFRRRKEFKKYLREELESVYGSIPERFNKMLK